jgi:hypothetical protein
MSKLANIGKKEEPTIVEYDRRTSIPEMLGCLFPFLVALIEVGTACCPEKGIALAQAGIDVPVWRQEDDIACHPSMNDEQIIVTEIENQIFTTSAHCFYAFAADLAGKCENVGAVDDTFAKDLR